MDVETAAAQVAAAWLAGKAGSVTLDSEAAAADCATVAVSIVYDTDPGAASALRRALSRLQGRTVSWGARR